MSLNIHPVLNTSRRAEFSTNKVPAFALKDVHLAALLHGCMIFTNRLDLLNERTSTACAVEVDRLEKFVLKPEFIDSLAYRRLMVLVTLSQASAFFC